MPTSTSERAAQWLRSRALAAGFDAAAIAAIPEHWEAEARLREAVAAGHHATMAWMETHLERRVHPRALWPQARSALVVALNYGPGHDPRADLHARTQGNISVYARGSDYHDVLKSRLKALAREFAGETGHEVKVFVDTAPLMEKPLAALAGLGWQGKHTNLLSRELGNWFFLGVMLSDAVLAPDPAAQEHCGRCTACLDACPTQAFPSPFRLDARRCLSYLTIEHKGPIPREFRAAMGNRIYGCDDCLAACPWNKFAATAHVSALQARAQNILPDLDALAGLDDAAFRALFAGSPVKRTGRDRFVRNVLIAIGNSATPALLPAVLARLEDSAALVRGAAAWALWRLDPQRFAREAETRRDAEPDAEARAEWMAQG